jgi:hypothetical protein
VSSRQATPLNSDDDDGESMSYDQQRALNLGKKMAQRSVPRSPSAPSSQKTSGGAPGTRSRAVPDPPTSGGSDTSTRADTKAAASQRAPADQSKGAKAPPPTKGQAKGQESPVAKATHPMASRTRTASGAGGLRGVDGSGQTKGRGRASPPS